MENLLALVSIMTVNLLLSGDNALIIALASRRLPPAQQHAAMLWGSAGAIVLRVILTIVAVLLLRVPYLQLAGGLLLQWVAVKLVTAEPARRQVNAASDLWFAVKTILMADLVMSLDNVIAIAAVARGNIMLLVVGLGLSIPVIVWGSKLVAQLMSRWPVVVVAGAAFLGWTAGDMAVADVTLQPFIQNQPWLSWAVPAIFAAAVVAADLLKADKPGKETG
jgi:YjbE family integral membrane protein